MPDWLADFLGDWAPFAGVAVFVLGAIGGALAGVSRLLYSLFANGIVVSKSRHQAEVDFYTSQIKLCKEAADRRIAELTKDVADLVIERDKWENRFWRTAEAANFLVRRDTPPHGTKRPEAGA